MAKKIFQEWAQLIPPLSILLVFLVSIKTKVVIHTPSHVGKWSTIDQYGFPWSYTKYSMASSLQYDIYTLPLIGNIVVYLVILSGIFYFFKEKRVSIFAKLIIWIPCIFMSIVMIITAAIGHTYYQSPWHVEKVISKSFYIGMPFEDEESYIELPIYTNPQ